MSGTHALLDTRTLAVGHPRRALFDGLSFSVRAGEVWCVLGPNGAGKTTLFRTLLGLLPAQAGDVYLGGEPLARLDAATRARRVAYVPQMGASHFAFRVRDVVLMGRTAHLPLFAAPGARDHAAADAALHELGITDLAQRTIDTLSGGEQRLAWLARALAQEAPLLVLDEPAAHLDIAHQAMILEVIRRLASRARAVIYSTHDPSHALDGATHALLVGRGGMPAHGPVAEILDATRLTELYGAPMEFLRDAHGRVAACRARTALDAFK
ncbi:MAG: ABC transporter ATP-binding protein [Betaproteobacteria bacterium]|nr:ABC transporter ATP-binding protein [Betaproteobacteria bacterium]